jgi:hypothetical protein
MSYRNGKGSRQGGLKAMPVHKVMARLFGANFCPSCLDSRNIIAQNPPAGY